MYDTHGIYLYCFARPGATEGLSEPGVDGSVPVSALDVGDIAAVISPVQPGEFEAPEGSSEPPDAAWIIPRACRHERIIEAVMDRSPVLPVRFGSIFSSPDALIRYSEGQQLAIDRFLDHVKDRSEWSVKAFLDVDRVVSWLLRTEPVLSEARGQLPASAGARYFPEKKLNEHARRQARNWGRALAREIEQAVPPTADEFHRLPLEVAQRAGQEMFLHLTLLVPKAAVEAFLADLEQFAARYSEQGLRLQHSGPWPPFHFCPTLEPSRQ
jgi:gas vesicle protein GvpL/GvpF